MRKCFYTPAAIPNSSVAFSGFRYNFGVEADNDNAVAYHAAIELTDGTIREALVGGASGLLNVPAGTVLAQTDKIDGLTIFAWFYWARVFGQVTSGQFYYYTDFFRSATLGAIEEGAGLADKAVSGTIGGAAQFLPGGLIGVIGDMPTTSRLFALPGDSISVGVGGYVHPTLTTAIGICAGIVAQIGLGASVHMGRAGASALSYQAGFTKRAALMAALGATDSFSDLGTNDLVGSSGAAALKASQKALNAVIKSANPTIKLWQGSVLPTTNVTT
jgi:hypothetical protein